MIKVKEGHVYELQNFESDTTQTINFVEKVKKSPDSDELETVLIGTTNEEVLTVLIDRLKFLGAKFASRENALAITKCEEALMWLNERTRNRKERGVEGKHIL